MRAQIMRDADKLEHNKNEGFYDLELDMTFGDLNTWCKWKWGRDFDKVISNTL